jgi:uncharacterized membrane protein YkoI
MVVGTISFTQPAMAGKKLNQNEARELVEQGIIQSLDKILARHQLDKNSRLLDVDLERDHGRIIYELEVIGNDGVVREYYFDAKDGQLLKEEIED